MKVLLLGDASNYHSSLAQGLTALGHDVKVASNGSRWMNTARDIDISRKPGRIGGLWLWIKLNTILASDLKGYDVVHISNPIFLEQRPNRVRAIFDRLKRDNGAVFLTALGTDTPYVDMCLSPGSPLRYSEWRVGGEPTPYALERLHIAKAWLSDPLLSHTQYVYEHIDGAVSALYEYYLSAQRMLPADKVAYGGIPIECPAISTSTIASNPTDPIRIMVACHKGREHEKGVDLMLPVLRKAVEATDGKAEIDLVQDAPFEEFQRILDRADIIVDQLYSYTPATSALMAMARGKVAITGGEKEYYDFIGEKKVRPIINPDPNNIARLGDDIMNLLRNREKLRRLGHEGIEFVRKHNGQETVARRFVEFWERRAK